MKDSLPEGEAGYDRTFDKKLKAMHWMAAMLPR